MMVLAEFGVLFMASGCIVENPIYLLAATLDDAIEWDSKHFPANWVASNYGKTKLFEADLFDWPGFTYW